MTVASLWLRLTFITTI